jgi:DNA-binding NarL/FixJ family response regulator
MNSTGERNSDGQPIPISVVSNSHLMREGIVGMLTSYIPLMQVGGYGLDAWADVSSTLPGHIVLIDGNCERRMLLDCIRHLRAASVKRILVCELDYDIDLILACIEAGAGGYMLKSASAQELAAALNAMRNNQALCHPEVAAKVFARLSDLGSTRQMTAPLPHLTGREWEVLGYLGQEYSNQQIATALRIEVRTVKHHVHNILEKLALTNRRDAARFAAEQGLLKPGLGRTTPSLRIIQRDTD